MTKYATKWVAPIATAEGYRVGYCAASSREAAEFRATQEIACGFDAKVIEVHADEWQAIIEGDWNHHTQPGAKA